MAYVNNTMLQEALLQSHLAGHVTEDCYKMFDDIAKQRIKIMLKYNIAEHYEAMRMACVDKCLRIWQNYSFKRDNAFAYFVTVIDNTCKLYFIQNDIQTISIEEQEARYKDSD